MFGAMGWREDAGLGGSLALARTRGFYSSWLCEWAATVTSKLELAYGKSLP